MLGQNGTDICCTNSLLNCVSPPSKNHRDIGKDKDKCDGGEDEDGKEQNTPRGRKTANSQGRRKGRITTRSMANEAASVAAEEVPPPAPEPALPDPPLLPKPDPMQKSLKEPAKPQTPVASMDANKGKSSWRCSLEVVENVFIFQQIDTLVPQRKEIKPTFHHKVCKEKNVFSSD